MSPKSAARTEVRLAGEGGQGMILAGIILAEAAAIYPEVLEADVVVTLSQEAYDKFAAGRRPGGLLIVDEDKVAAEASPEAVRLPITKMAFETTGRTITANAVALGVLVGLTGVVPPEAIEKAMAGRAPRGTEELNRKALEAGLAAAKRIGKRS
jgi:2-oxoglutarate ferredoxin oxidoreductase subunit gamma